MTLFESLFDTLQCMIVFAIVGLIFVVLKSW